MIEARAVVTYPNPLEIAKIAALIERYQHHAGLTTPTFLRGYMRKAEPAQLASLEAARHRRGKAAARICRKPSRSDLG